MNEVLVVEDSWVVSRLLATQIRARTDAPVSIATSRAQAESLLAEDPKRFFVAVSDVGLPDAPNGEVIDLLLERGIPTIVVTGSFDESLRDSILQKPIVDYIVKRNQAELDYVATLVRRVQQNQHTKILLVDDSNAVRQYVASLLGNHRYQVIQADHPVRGLELLEANPDVRLVITDYEMPEMTGAELIVRIREKHPRDELAIIAFSAHGSSSLSARLLKSGATDFLTKPFAVEEFYCRVSQNIELVERFETIRDAAQRDYLTNLHNRRFLFESGARLFDDARRGNLRLASAVLDVDFFKRINDTYGHDAGDIVLKKMAAILRAHAGERDLVARLGGEEFALLLVDQSEDRLQASLEALRAAIEASIAEHAGSTIRFTASIGVAPHLADTLEKTLKIADEAMYRAKTSGRNRVVFGGSSSEAG